MILDVSLAQLLGSKDPDAGDLKLPSLVDLKDDGDISPRDLFHLRDDLRLVIPFFLVEQPRPLRIAGNDLWIEHPALCQRDLFLDLVGGNLLVAADFDLPD